MAASGPKYGHHDLQFYWTRHPSMVFGIFMIAITTYGSKAVAVPEYLKLRFDNKTHAFNAISFARMTVFSSGISLHRPGGLLET